MARATPSNYLSPQIREDEDEDAMAETAAALIGLQKMPFVFSKKSIAKPIGKSRFSRESQEVSGNGPMRIDQITDDIFDATKALVIHRGLGDVAVEQPKLMFSDEELGDVLNVVKVEEDIVQVFCACTSKKHGDYVGILTIYRDGNLRINCKCSPRCVLVGSGCRRCMTENATPEQFVSHARAKLGPSQWPKCIWVHNVEGVRTKIQETPFLKYFQEAGMRIGKRQRWRFHRDEFLKCSLCNVERRFRQTNMEECRAYHDAVLLKNSWTCSLHPYDKICCSSEDERASRKLVRGCPRLGCCGGCPLCVCWGCVMCRFPDCGCRVCMDFTRNS